MTAKNDNNKQQPNETRYRYEPCADAPDLRYTPENERRILHGYNEWDLII